MESMRIALETVLPLFLMMVAGFIIRAAKIMNEEAVRQTNRAIFRVFLPLLVFRNIYTTELAVSFSSPLLIYAVAAVLVEFSLALVIVFLTERDNARRGVMLQGMFRSNFVIFGIPVCTALFGSEAAGTASLLIAVIIPLFNVLAVVALEMFNGSRPNLGHVLVGIITNPLIIASAAGLLVIFFQVPIPGFLDSAIASLGGIATPLAFVVLGASLAFKEIGDCAGSLAVTLVVKLLIFPVIFLSLAILLGFRGVSLAVLLTLFGSPVAVSSFTMAQQMGGHEKLAAHLVVFSSALSIVTLFLLIFGLRYFAFL